MNPLAMFAQHTPLRNILRPGTYRFGIDLSSLPDTVHRGSPRQREDLHRNAVKGRSARLEAQP